MDADDKDDDEPYANSEVPTDAESDGPDDFDFPDEPLEEGDRIWATGLFPQAEHIHATATVWQRASDKTLSQWATSMCHHTSTSSVPSSPRKASMSCQSLSRGIMQSNSLQMHCQRAARYIHCLLPNRRSWTRSSRKTSSLVGSGCQNPQWLRQSSSSRRRTASYAWCRTTAH